MSQSDLLVNARGEPRALNVIEREIESADRIDLIIAFIRWSGLRLFEEKLRAFTERGGELRVITTTYTGSTERRAIEHLISLGGQVKVSYQTDNTRLHAKAWLFHRRSGFSTVFIGSSNLSTSAMLEGVEWNVRLSSVDAPTIVEKFAATFDGYWADADYDSYDPARDAEKYWYLGLVATGDSWSLQEVEAVVADYFSMLEKELRREPYNKSEHRRRLRELLRARSDGSIERKHQNISAILIEARFPPIPGYKPLFNYQSLLSDVVLEHIEGDAVLLGVARSYVETPVLGSAPTDILSRMVRPPEILEQVRAALAEQKRGRYGRQIDYLALEARNRTLGGSGEDFVVAYEKARLASIGASALALKVERVSSTRGDGLGFDVLSFFPDARERFIEVKTTQLGSSTPFYVSRNELAFSREERDAFSLYRVFGFASDPKFFALDGDLATTCMLEPNQYLAAPR